MSELWKLIKLPFKLFWRVMMWLSMAYWISMGLIALLFGAIYLWLEISPPTRESIRLSIIESDRTKHNVETSLKELNRKLDHSVFFVKNNEAILNQIGCDGDLSTTEDELIELDTNETTYEVVIFKGELNASIESFHDFCIVQYQEDNMSSMRVLLHDYNATFPITIIENGSNWRKIRSNHRDGTVKEWDYDGVMYKITPQRLNLHFGFKFGVTKSGDSTSGV